jgi:hypothetical protein
VKNAGLCGISKNMRSLPKNAEKNAIALSHFSKGSVDVKNSSIRGCTGDIVYDHLKNSKNQLRSFEIRVW